MQKTLRKSVGSLIRAAGSPASLYAMRMDHGKKVRVPRKKAL
jgi:hypothetical protein